jgi:hypothetical protein
MFLSRRNYLNIRRRRPRYSSIQIHVTVKSERYRHAIAALLRFSRDSWRWRGLYADPILDLYGA